jgi:hypothetical protein
MACQIQVKSLEVYKNVMCEKSLLVHLYSEREAILSIFYGKGNGYKCKQCLQKLWNVCWSWDLLHAQK